MYSMSKWQDFSASSPALPHWQTLCTMWHAAMLMSMQSSCLHMLSDFSHANIQSQSLKAVKVQSQSPKATKVQSQDLTLFLMVIS